MPKNMNMIERHKPQNPADAVDDPGNEHRFQRAIGHGVLD